METPPVKAPFSSVKTSSAPTDTFVPAFRVDTVRAPHNTTSGRDFVKSLRLCLHGTRPQRFRVWSASACVCGGGVDQLLYSRSVASPARCPANMAHARQSRPDCGPGFQVKASSLCQVLRAHRHLRACKQAWGGGARECRHSREGVTLFEIPKQVCFDTSPVECFDPSPNNNLHQVSTCQLLARSVECVSSYTGILGDI